jgi:hypothetical protein
MKSENIQLDGPEAMLIFGLLDDCPWVVASNETRAVALGLLEKIRPLVQPQKEYQELKEIISP